MAMLHSHNLLLSHVSPLLPLSKPSLSLIHFRPTTRLCSSLGTEPTITQPESKPVSEAEPVSVEGPVELPPGTNTIFAVDDNPTPLQVATSVLLTGAISVFLFRSLRRRARRAKDLRVRSSGVKSTKDIKEEALESLKMMGVAPVEGPGGPPSPIQAALGGIAAGVIALMLYKFTTTIEASLNRQTISDNFSVRQITITVRTIINGLCYLATFVFGINSVGLLLYSIQLAISSLMESPDNNMKSSSENMDLNVIDDAAKSSLENAESVSSNMQEKSDDR